MRASRATAWTRARASCCSRSGGLHRERARDRRACARRAGGGRRYPRARARARLGRAAIRRRRRRAHRQGELRGGAPGAHRRRLDRRARRPAAPARAAGAAGARLAATATSRALRAGTLPGVQPAGAPKAATTASRSTRCPASSSAAITIAARRCRPRRCAARSMRRTRPCSAPSPTRYFPDGSGATMALRSLHVHQHAGRAFHRRSSSGREAGRARLALLGTWLQVLLA